MSSNKLSLFDAILMNMNIMVGGGVFVGPAIMAAHAGNASFLAWPIAACIFMPLIISIVQVMKFFPQGGGFFLYMKNGIGESKGFLGSWIYTMGYFLVCPIMLLSFHNAMISMLGKTMITESTNLFLAATLIVLFFLMIQPVSVIAKIQSYLTIVKLIPFLAAIVFLFFHIDPGFTITTAELKSLPSAVFPWALFGLLGFEVCTSITHLIEDGEKNSLKAVLFGFAGAVTICTLFHLGVLHIMGVKNLISDNANLFARYIHAPKPVVKTIDFLVLISMGLTFFNSLFGIAFSNVAFSSIILDKNLVHGGNHLIKKNLYDRPVTLIALHLFIIFLISICCGNIPLLANYANIALFLAFTGVFSSLIILNRNQQKWNAIIINIVAISIALSIVVYSMYSMGATWQERALYILPFGLVVGVGPLLYKKQIISLHETE
ncbi:hypothetical protein COB28_00565 [Candidatus Dependentiae bacterium]|nr:MAG: hypothetical protein COB28_00565 [Candidatus Dependentiae bacterium]